MGEYPSETSGFLSLKDALASTFTAIVGTVGVALMGIAASLNFPAPLTAGVLCGFQR